MDETDSPAETGSPTETGSPVDAFLDELLPESFEWRRMVSAYPRTAMAVAATGGFWLGRRHGMDLLSGALSMAADEVSKQVRAVAGDFLDDRDL